jgi:hypothetical protein|tara:strand:- start:1582 stop:2241 length:660 start_codon:yes stop_codon:yes gene_type:complete
MKASMIYAVLAGAMLLSGCASEYAYLPKESAVRLTYPQAKEMSRRYRDIPTCTRFQEEYDAQGWPKGDSIEVMREIDARVRDRFVYRRELDDTWQSHVDIMLMTEHRWAGDCDDLAATVVALGRCAGVPEDRLGFMLVKVNGSDSVNHMLGFYTDTSGRSHAVGDTFGRPRPLLTEAQEPYAWTFLDNVEIWNRVDTTTAFDDPSVSVVATAQKGKPAQ